METTRGTISVGARGIKTRAAVAAAAVAATLATSFALGRVTAPAAEAPALRPAPVVVTQPAERSPLQPHARHNQVKVGG